MKYILALFISALSTVGYAQQLNVGIGLGKLDDLNMVTLGGAVEYKPYKSLFSINSDPFLLIALDNQAILTLPLYLKLNFGKALRLCPSIGAFVRTNSNYGWTRGLSVEFDLSEKYILSAKGDYMTDYYKNTSPGKFGGYNEYTDFDSSIMFSLGIKKTIFTHP